MITIGIDVSKAKIDCLWLRDVVTGKVKSKVFKNTAEGHSALLQWAIKNAHVESDEIHFIMEATGIYHEALAYALYEAGTNVSVVNPAQISSYGKSFGVRSKTDKKDSFVIARFGATQQPRLWHPEPSEIRTLKALISRYDAVCQDIQRESNRLEKATIGGGVPDEVITSIETILVQLKAEKKRLEGLINKHFGQHPNLKQDRALLESIPGIGPIVSRLMISVIRSRKFTAAPQCAAFLGLVPVQHESGSSVRGKSRLSKAGNASIRAKLYMAAVVAIQHNPDIKQQYERLLKNGKSKMSALGAAMRKLVQICFGVLKHQTPYQSRVN
jgi:transposase